MKIGSNIITAKYYTQNNNNGVKYNALNSSQRDTVEFSSNPDVTKPANNGYKALAFKGLIDDLIDRIYGNNALSPKNDKNKRRKHNNELNKLLNTYEKEKFHFRLEEKANYYNRILKGIDSPLFDMSMINPDYNGEFRRLMEMENSLRQNLTNGCDRLFENEGLQQLFKNASADKIDKTIKLFSCPKQVEDTLGKTLTTLAKSALIEGSYETLKQIKEMNMPGSIMMDFDGVRKPFVCAVHHYSTDERIRGLYNYMDYVMEAVNGDDVDEEKFAKHLRYIYKESADDYADTMSELLNNPNKNVYRKALAKHIVSGDQKRLGYLKDLLEKKKPTDSPEEIQEVYRKNNEIVETLLKETDIQNPEILNKYIFKHIFNNENVNLFYNSDKPDGIIPKMINNTSDLDPKYNGTMTAEILLNAFNQEPMPEIYSYEDSISGKYHLPRDIDAYFDSLAKEGESVNEMKNFFKKYFAMGGKTSFNQIGNKKYLDILMESGINLDSKDMRDRTLKQTLNIRKNPELLSIIPLKERLIDPESDIRDVITSEFNNLLFLNSMIDKYTEMESIILADKNVSNEKEINDKETILTDIFKFKISNLEFSDKDLADGIDKLLSSGAKNRKQLTKSLLKKISSYDIQASAISKMLAAKVRRIEIPLKNQPALGKALLQQYLSDKPEIQEGICSMEEFSKLFKNREDKPLLDGYFTTPFNDHGDTLFDIMLGIPCETDEDKKLKQDVLNSLKDSEYENWNYTDENNNSLAMKTALAEDSILLQFLKDKNVDFSQKNSYGKTALDIINESQNSEIKEITKDLKIHSNEILQAANSGNLSLFKMIAKNNLIDINSRDEDGYTPWLRAARSGAVNIAEQLMTRDDVDFNAKTHSGNDFIDIALHFGNIDFLQKILPAYSSINKDAINRINEFIQFKALSDDVSKDMLKDLLDIDGVNPNIALKDDYNNRPMAPVAFRLLRALTGRRYNNNDTSLMVAKLEILAESGKLDMSAKYKGKTLLDCIKNAHFADDYIEEVVLEKLNEAAENQILQQVKDRIKQDGFLSLQNITEFLAAPNIKNLIDMSLSDDGETIAHYLAEIPVDENNYKDILNAAEKIHKLNHKVFLYKDRYEQTPLHKIIMSGNEILLEFYLQQHNSNLTAVEKIAKTVDNPEINDLIKYYKNKR